MLNHAHPQSQASAQPVTPAAQPSNTQRAWFMHGLSAQIDALTAARRGLETADQASSALSVRRIARHLSRLARRYDSTEVAGVSEKLALVADSELAEASEELVAVLQAQASRAQSRQLGILIVEDSPDVLMLLRARLAAPNRKIFSATTVAEAKERLRERDIDVVLLDLLLPDGDGRDLLMWARAQPKTLDLPVFILSASGTASAKTECYALGADGFFEKGPEIETAATAIAAHLQRSSEVSQMLRRDPLTGLAKRDVFINELERLRTNFQKTSTPLSMAILDLDHFKSINDTYGHQAGDDVLRHTAKLIASKIRPIDLLARWGGEEFVLLLPSMSATAVKTLLESILVVVKETTFRTVDNRKFNMSFSAGVTQVDPHQDWEASLARADEALYKAKKQGRNRVVEAP